MKQLKRVLAGAICGGIGVAVWVAIGYGTGYEVGWIAWGIGFLAGEGVRAASQGEEGLAQGVTATGVAIVCILAAKYLVVSLYVSKELSKLAPPSVTAEMMIAQEAEKVATEKGEAIERPPERDSEDAPIEKTYPPQIRAEATKRWNALSREDQKEAIAAQQKAMARAWEGFTKELRSSVVREAYKKSFSPLDGLWFLLAAITAYKVGSGTSTG